MEEHGVIDVGEQDLIANLLLKVLNGRVVLAVI